MKSPIRIGIVGMGGFAGSHHATIARLEERAHARLVCTCDPHPERFITEQQNWRSAPLLGQDNAYVFKELLGVSDDEFEVLAEEKVI